MNIEEEIARVIASAQNVPFVGPKQKRMAAALMPLVRRAQAEAIRDYAQRRYLDFLEHPEKSWHEQPEGTARTYAKVAADLKAQADRIENEGAGA